MITAWLMFHWKPIALALGVALAVGIGTHLWKQGTIASLTKQKAVLEQQNREISSKYDQAIGQAKAFEQTAREEKMKADALIATIEAGTKNVKALDDKLATAQGNYDKAKAELGDCGDTPDECTRKLCAELKAAGFKVPSCD
jgi:uncharacterized protein HemX